MPQQTRDDSDAASEPTLDNHAAAADATAPPNGSRDAGRRDDLKVAVATLTAVASLLAAVAGLLAALHHANGVDEDRRAITESMLIAEGTTRRVMEVHGVHSSWYANWRRLLGEADHANDPARGVYARGASRLVAQLFPPGAFNEREVDGARVFDPSPGVRVRELYETESSTDLDPAAAVASAEAQHQASLRVVRWMMAYAVAVVLLAASRLLPRRLARLVVGVSVLLIVAGAAGMIVDYGAGDLEV